MNHIDEDIPAMSHAHEAGDVDTVRRLVTARPELERLTPDRTWLHRAAMAGAVGLIDFWLDRGWDVNLNLYENVKTHGEATPLHHAKDAATTRHLLARGARKDVWTRYGGTALHFAVVRALDASQRGRPRPTPPEVTEQIRVLMEAGVDPAVADFEGKTPLGLAIELRRRAAEQVLRELGAPEKGRKPARQPTKAAPIDLRKDAKKIATTVRTAVKRFAREHRKLPVTGLYLAVSGIEGYVQVAFDTGSAGNPWDASHSEYAAVEFEKWRRAYELAAGGFRITGIDGTVVQSPGPMGDAEFERPFFRACVAVLEQAQADGVFEPLTRAAGFSLGVEATLGGDDWGWQPGATG